MPCGQRDVRGLPADEFQRHFSVMGCGCCAQIKFYPGRYAAEKCSILPVGDPTQYIPDNEVRTLPLLLLKAR